jgi:hypothetical protein
MSYRDLEIWQLAKEIAIEIHDLNEINNNKAASRKLPAASSILVIESNYNE